jgi:S1-C subfamily serine protease
VVVGIDGDEIRIVEDLLARLRQNAPGDRATLEIVREGDRREIEVTLGDRTQGC